MPQHQAGMMSPVQAAELITYRNSLDPAKLAADIGKWQKKLSEITAPVG